MLSIGYWSQSLIRTSYRKTIVSDPLTVSHPLRGIHPVPLSRPFSQGLHIQGWSQREILMQP